jgi:hypothetical protein
MRQYDFIPIAFMLGQREKGLSILKVGKRSIFCFKVIKNGEVDSEQIPKQIEIHLLFIKETFDL